MTSSPTLSDAPIPSPSLRAVVFTALAVELSAASLGLGVCAWAGKFNPWLDLVAQFGFVWLSLSVLSLLASLMLAFPPYRRKCLTLASAALVVNGALCLPEMAKAGLQGMSGLGAKPADFTLMTANIWDERKGNVALVKAILGSNADVVTLQEAVGFQKVEPQALRQAYPYQFTCPGEWGCELLMLSKRPLTHQSETLSHRSGPLGLVSATTTDAKGRAITIATTHLAWPIPGSARPRQIEALSRQLRALPLGPLILSGDFNGSAPSHTLEVQDHALAPLVRQTHANLTWPAIIARVGLLSPFQAIGIDHVYTTAGLSRSGAKMIRTGSDHLAILVKFVSR